MRTFIAVLALLGLAACATAPQAPPSERQGEILYSPVERLPRDGGGDAVALLSGAWSNAEQYAFIPEDLKRPPAPGHPYEWIDLQYAQFHPVNAPHIGEHVVYLEWRADGPDGEISRQRIWAFREAPDGALSGMDFYTFADPGPYAGRGGEPDAFAGLTNDDLIGYPDGCTLTARVPDWAGHVLDVSPQDCVIAARSGRNMGIEAHIEIARHHLSYREAGHLQGGGYAFMVPGGPPYEFKRVGGK